MKKMKWMSLGLSLVLSIGLLTGCGKEAPKREETVQKETTQKDVTEKKEITITDQNGRSVKVKYPVERIACMQHHSLDILTQLGELDRIVCTEDKLEKNLGNYITEMHPEIKDLPRPGSLKEPNVEAIAAQKPDLVLVAAQANPDAIKALEDLGIPTLVVTLRGEGKQDEAQNPRLSNADKAYTDGLEWVIQTLGTLTGAEERAEKLWAFCKESRKMVEDKVNDVADADRVRVFVANENDQTYGDDKYVGCQLLRAGAVNVAAEEIKGYKPYNMEQLAKWNPDVIIVQDRYPEVYEKVTTDPQYAELKAVRDGRVIVAPYWSKPWGNPDTDSIALGELWLAHQFYPDKIDRATVEERAKEFYKMFYETDFKGEVK
ncbi:MAG: ABC transporter substrate-binding protein, partial [Eubacteriales bacterium]|nr:ABC transporter substrate-binding protein [Eubacteriales bacterium]